MAALIALVNIFWYFLSLYSLCRLPGVLLTIFLGRGNADAARAASGFDALSWTDLFLPWKWVDAMFDETVSAVRWWFRLFKEGARRTVGVWRILVS
jgi:hypothetical protein